MGGGGGGGGGGCGVEIEFQLGEVVIYERVRGCGIVWNRHSRDCCEV